MEEEPGGVKMVHGKERLRKGQCRLSGGKGSHLLGEVCAAERLLVQLIRYGWKMQKLGMVYVNGSLGTHLYRDGKALLVSQEFHPDEEFVEWEWPEVTDESK